MTELSARMLGYSFENDSESKQTYALLVQLINKVLLIAKKDGTVKGKSEILNLTHRGWLLWNDYMTSRNRGVFPDILAFIKEAEALLEQQS